MLTFRAATAADVPLLVDLVQSAYRGEGSKAGWTTEAELLDGLRTDPERMAEQVAGGHVLVALTKDGELAGCCELRLKGERGYFGMFSVPPTQQGLGTGSAILSAAERRAAEEWGVREMEMTVLSGRDELVAFYRRRGYQPTGDTQPFPDDERFGIPKVEGLHFRVLVKTLR